MTAKELASILPSFLIHLSPASQNIGEKFYNGRPELPRKANKYQI